MRLRSLPLPNLSRSFTSEAFKSDAFRPEPFKPEPSIDLSGLQEQLREMTARIEALRPSNELEKAIGGLRADLAEISRSFAEALPRRALESLETEVRTLGQRVDRGRQAGVDAAALSGIERGLSEVRGALRGLMPAEGLAGFDGALKAIASKVDAIGAKDDPAALQQLEAAMEVLRGMIARVASDEALAKVAEDVRAFRSRSIARPRAGRANPRSQRSKTASIFSPVRSMPRPRPATPFHASSRSCCPACSRSSNGCSSPTPIAQR